MIEKTLQETIISKLFCKPHDRKSHDRFYLTGKAIAKLYSIDNNIHMLISNCFLLSITDMRKVHHFDMVGMNKILTRAGLAIKINKIITDDGKYKKL